MKTLIAFAMLIGAQCVFGQDTLSKIDELRPPSSPGFSILGIQPTDISRPKSWRDVETNVSSSFMQDDKLIIPKNFAMEFNPFFSLGTRNSEPDPAYIYRDDADDNLKTIRYNSAISIATGEFNSYADTSLRNPRMGIGYRTLFVEYKVPPEAKLMFKQLGNMQENINYITAALRHMKDTAKFKTLSSDNIVAVLKGEIRVMLADSITSLNGCMDIIDFMSPQLESVDAALDRRQYIRKLNEIIVSYTDEYKFQSTRQFAEDGMRKRYGWCIEGAAAMLLDFPTNTMSFSKVPKFGFWGTYTWRSQNQHWEIAGLTRYITSKFDTLARYNNFDFGFRGMVTNEKWSINAEYVQRIQFRVVDKDAAPDNEISFHYSLNFKLALTVNYKLTDDIVLNYTFGNNLTINTEFESDPKKIVSNVGLIYAFGGPRVKDVVK